MADLKRSLQKIIELPFDMEEETLARVPVKDLLRFRCDCTRWGLLFTNKEFIAKHMTFAPRKFLSVPHRHHPPRSIVYQQRDRNRGPKMIREEHDLTAGYKDLIDVEIVDHCDGLFCLGLQNKTLAVWNPSLRELKKVTISADPYSLEHVGFGYDHTIDDYKIIVLRSKYSYMKISKNEVEIFMLKSKSRVIDYPIDFNALVYTRAWLGKNIFWLVWLYDRHIANYLILRFDIMSEIFKEISFPHFNYEFSYAKFWHLQIVRRHFCVVEFLKDVLTNKIVVGPLIRAMVSITRNLGSSGSRYQLPT